MNSDHDTEALLLIINQMKKDHEKALIMLSDRLHAVETELVKQGLAFNEIAETLKVFRK